VKILALRGSNIASLASFEVDFEAEPLRSAGIFAIVGPTGSGKSSLLDAMCLALYQRAPRLDDLSVQEGKLESRFGTISQSDIRNLLRRGCETGHAECDFRSGDGCAYRVRWGYRAPRKSGAKVQEEMSLVRLDDGQVLFDTAGRKGEFQATVERLVGLSYGQFTRTVLLAQGRFAEFLRSRENERADLLERLTGTVLYSRISRRVHERTRALQEERKGLERDLAQLPVLEEEARAGREQEQERLGLRIPALEGRHETLRALLEGAGRLQETARSRERLELEVTASAPLVSQRERELAQARETLAAQQARGQALAPDLEKARELDGQLRSGSELLRERQAELDRTKAQLAARELELQARRDAVKELELKQEEDTAWLEARQGKLEPLAQEWSRWHTLLEQATRRREPIAQAEAESVALGREIEAEAADIQAILKELETIDLPAEITPSLVQESLQRLQDRATALAGLEPWLALQERIARHLATGQEALQQGQILSNRLPQAVAAWEEAKRLFDATTLVLSSDVTHLRSRLAPGENCPVCGSQEHPWTGQAPLLDSVLDAHRGNEAATRQALEELQGQIREQAALERRAGTERKADQERLARLQVDPALLQELEAAGDAQAWLRDALETLRKDEQLWKAKRELATRRDGLQARHALLETRHGNSQDKLERLLASLALLRDEQAQTLSQLDVPFGSSDWQAPWTEKPTFLSQLEANMAQYLQRQTQREARSRDLLAKATELAGLEQDLAQRHEEFARMDADQTARRKAHELLQAERARHFDGRTVAEVEADLNARLEEERRRIEEAQEALQSLRERQSALQGQAEQLKERHGREQAEVDALASRFEPDDGTFSLDPETLAHLEGRRKDGARELGELREASTRLALELEQDDTHRENARNLRRRIATCNETLEHWSLLDGEIGSADGKAFKLIAQQFTLETLLEETNLQLRTIAPRYTLKRLGGSMHFGVIDHESFGEMRPVQTLSGGETFLVSLGLALGLSRMAGGDLSVETLFIDEGFGTLDGETLQGVMAALSGLHAQGRKVGLITHVEEMKEQIPVQVRVTKLGQGRSRVEVVG